jgi:hypothetical protein
MKNTTQTKFIEDLLQEEELNVDVILNAKFKNPFKTWFNYKIFILGVFLREQQFNLRLLAKKLTQRNK